MCGIIGIITTEKRNLIPELVSSLCHLEYRGYDSTGIAILDEGSIKRVRRVGAPSDVLRKVEVLEELAPSSGGFSLGIGHNRWATHGKPSERNAHPHTDCTGTVTLVHNGTILNYESLKKDLLALGHVFVSETDTEVIPHLIEEERKKGTPVRDAFINAVNKLEGSFGIALMVQDAPEQLFLAKRGSPLLFGISDNALIAASSSNAVLAYTSTIITLSDGEYAELSNANDALTYTIGSLDERGKMLEKTPTKVTGFSLDDISKGDHDSFMHKEIYEQPAAFRTTILGRFNGKTGDAVLGGLIDYEDVLKSAKNILTIACGTAHNAAVVGGSVIEALAGISVRNEIASEFRYKKLPPQSEQTAVFAISQSGETADTLESVKESVRKGYKTFGIVNVVGSSIAETVDAGVYTRAGVEIGVASTKAFTSQLAVFYLLALKLARERTLTPREGTHFIEELERIPTLMQKTIEDTEELVETLAKKYASKKLRTINFLGRGIHVALGAEAALKFKELTYQEAGSYPLGELKHGPIAVIDEHSLSVVIMPKDELFALSKNSIEQIRSKGGEVVIVTDEQGAKELASLNLTIVTIPSLEHKLLYPLLEIIPLQLFAYSFAKHLGNNVDKPRNLAKSVTVE